METWIKLRYHNEKDAIHERQNGPHGASDAVGEISRMQTLLITLTMETSTTRANIYIFHSSC